MAENTALQPVPPAAPPARKRKKKVEEAMGLNELEKWMKTSGFKKLDGIKLRGRAKVGAFIEQEGEHHIARACIANTFADLEEFKETCEEKLANAKANKDDAEYEKWLRLSLTVAEQMNKAAQHLNMTRRKVDPNDQPSAFKVPTMPARTVITNNTQIVVQPPKTE